MIPEEQYRQWVVLLEERLRSAVVAGRSTDEACQLVEGQARDEFGWDETALEARLRAVAEAVRSYRDKLKRVSYLQKVALRFGRELWYSGPAENADNWHGLRQRLLSDKGRSKESVGILDDESTTILSLMDNPGKPKFSTRGLVVGHVQSGKTGNMAAVIAKAADTPFKFFLVLSGMTDTLRHQTQVRLEQDVVATAPPDRWYLWTAKDSDVDGAAVKGDFSHPSSVGFGFNNCNQLAVIKKNAGVLRRFLAKLRNTDQATLRDTPFLIIDDECDQASVNSAALATAVTRINGYIRDLLRMLPRASYVGYTATPFANVLIDPTVPEDLYPRHFIHALQRPKEYFGAERLFGRSALDGEHDEDQDGLDMIRSVPDTDLPALRPTPGAQGPFRCRVPKSLSDAIHYFILVTAAREVRGQKNEHSTMLVHTSVLNSVHRSTEAAIRPYLTSIISKLRVEDPVMVKAFADQWDAEQDLVLAEEFDLTRVPFDRLRPILASVAASIEVKVENWSSTNRIDYSVPARRYLVIGGNVLARGLTLEGLSVSFFLRSSSQYDTLMQMGRWFGYRPGFDDLPRVWMEEHVQDNFFDLATVEAEIRNEIKRYASEEITPEEFAVRIRRIPGMAITAQAKMRNAVIVSIGYSGSHQQTTRFHRKNQKWLQDNWTAGGDLLRSGGSLEQLGSAHVLRNVDVKHIVKFLRTYSVHESHRQMSSDLLIQYIDREALHTWNVAVVTAEAASPSASSLGPLDAVKMVRRSALKGSGPEACIKALMSKADVFADMALKPRVLDDWKAYKRDRQAAAMPPLLLLYPIDRYSEPLNSRLGSKKPRMPLDAVTDVLGIGIVFPGGHADPRVFVAANLTPDDAVEIPEGDDALPVDITDTAQAS